MPPVASLEALHRAIAEFRVADLDLVIEPIAQAAARRSLSQSGLLVVAGNAHTPVTSTDLGVPLGACLTAQRPGVREVRIRYGRGAYYNGGPRQFRPTRPPGQQVRLHQQDSQLVLDVPIAHEGLVPHRPMTGCGPDTNPARSDALDAADPADPADPRILTRRRVLLVLA